MAQNHYDTLGISRGASAKDIRNAYRRLARKYHPDVNQGSKGAQEKFKKVNAAYEVLSNPDNRTKYDQFGDKWSYVDSGREPDSRRGFDFAGSGFRSFFESANTGFGSNQSRHRDPPSEPIEVPLDLTLEEAAAGVKRVIQTPVLLGKQPKRVEATIPPGVDSGSRIHVPMGGGLNVYLVIKVRSHHRFTRKKYDLYVELVVPLVDVVLGSQQEAPTLGGRVLLTVPPETQNGQVFRLRNKGMPYLKTPSERGDLFVTIKVILPTELSEKEKGLFKELREVRISDH
jgi:curved DNA-binding protein